MYETNWHKKMIAKNKNRIFRGLLLASGLGFIVGLMRMIEYLPGVDAKGLLFMLCAIFASIMALCDLLYISLKPKDLEKL